MEQEKVTKPIEENTLSADELKRLTSFFEILIQIDQRKKEKECKK